MVWTVGVIALSFYLMKQRMSVTNMTIAYDNAQPHSITNISSRDIKNAKISTRTTDEVRMLTNKNELPSQVNFKAEAMAFETKPKAALESVPMELAGAFTGF